MKSFFNRPFLPMYEGEGDGKGGGGGVVFTPEQQTHINGILATEKRKYKEQMDALTTKLSDAKMTAEQRDALAQELETVRTSLRTKEEQAEHEKTQMLNQQKQQVELLTKERDNWLNAYTDSTISRSLLDAGAANEAVNAAQIEQMLRPKASLQPELDTNQKKTGKMVPMVKIALPDKDGNMQELTLTPNDAVKRMKEAKTVHGNLFKNGAHGGVGGTGPDAPGKDKSLAELANDPAAYRKARAEGKVGLKPGA